MTDAIGGFVQRRIALTSVVFLALLSGLSSQTGQVVVAQQTAISEEVSPEMEKRLARLVTRLDEEREKLHIPGMAIAIVQDGKLIFAEGIGLCDVANNKPVTPETIFAIGSSTKAFTATLIGMLADDGVMSFDDPVEKHIPGFQLKTEGDGEVTFRDLLCHRTGFTRMGVLWASGKLTRPEVIERAATATPTKKLREAFQYNNVMYMTAGYGAGLAEDSTWEELTASRILQPLGMTNSNTSVEQAKQDERLSIGYRWDEDAEEFEILPMRNLDLIGPAGSINSNVIDMAQWLKFQLARGEIDGKRLIQETTLAETWSPQSKVGGNVEYGLGWMLQEWNGKKVVEHGGNIDGFAAQVTLLPEENIGYVLLCNVTATPLQGGSISIVFDTLLGEDDANSGSETTTVFDGLAGVYEPSFGGLQGKKLTVAVTDDKLHVDVPGQMNFELKSPDEEGKWYFAMTDTIAVSFQKSDNGTVQGMTIHQGGLNLECPREGVEREIEVPLDELQPLLGTYHDPEADIDVQVVIYKNRLGIEVPQQGTMEFFPPDDEDRWAFRPKKDLFQIRFNRGADGRVTSVTRFKDGEENEMPRKADSEESTDSLPDSETILELIRSGFGINDTTTVGNVKMAGKANFVSQGATGTTELLFSDSSCFTSTIDLGKLGYIRESVDTSGGWSDSSFSTFDELTGDDLAMARLRHPLWIFSDWNSNLENPVVSRQEDLNGNSVYVVLFTGKDIPNRTLYVDTENGRILKEDSAMLIPGIGTLPITTSYSNYQKAGDMILPFEILSKNDANGEMLLQYELATSVAEKPDYVLTNPEKD